MLRGFWGEKGEEGECFWMSLGVGRVVKGGLESGLVVFGRLEMMVGDKERM